MKQLFRDYQIRISSITLFIAASKPEEKETVEPAN